MTTERWLTGSLEGLEDHAEALRRLEEFMERASGDLDGPGLQVVDNEAAVFNKDSGRRVKSSGVQLHSGTGTPESSVTAPVGSMYTRTDGGASTTLYIKESGTGNTGWVAK